jgi:RimJ/RimL family protein N-acetyltransferase
MRPGRTASASEESRNQGWPALTGVLGGLAVRGHGGDWLRPRVEFWGHGYATEAARASIRHGFEVIGLGRIISTTCADHWASRRVMEKCGMSFQGTVRWRDADIAWYAADRP